MNSSRAPSRAFRFAKAYGGGGEGGGEGGGGKGGGGESGGERGLAWLREWHVVFHDFDRRGHDARPGACTPMPTCQWIEFRAGNLGVDTSGMGLSIAADLELLAQGDVFVGQFDSTVGNLAWHKMSARLGVLAPWVHYQEKPVKLSNHPFRRGFA